MPSGRFSMPGQPIQALFENARPESAHFVPILTWPILKSDISTTDESPETGS
jgi:hypothetical protein